MTRSPPDPDKILDVACELAGKSSWEAFSITDLARRLDYSLVDIKRLYRSKDDMAEGLFDRADDTMLQFASRADFQARPAEEKLPEVIMCWFESMAPIKPLIREILAYKFEPGHFHLQAHGITRVSRTVQWFLVSAARQKTGFARIADEVAITSAYLTSFSFFLFDKSESHTNTRALLKRLLRKIDQGHEFLSAKAPLKTSSPPAGPKA